MQDLSVAQGDVAHRIAGRGYLVTHKPDHGEFVSVRAQRHFLAEREPGRAVDDHFVVAAQDLTPVREFAGAAGPARLEADEEEAQWLVVQVGLDRLVGNGTGAFHAIDPADQFPRIAGDARGFGERPIGAGLDHPEIGMSRAGLPQRVVNHATVDAGDHDHDSEQQAEAEVGQNEAQQIVLDIPISQIHRLGSSATLAAILAARPTRKPLRTGATTSALSGTPPVIS